ncbi:MAG TPA: hypothetical protein VIB99_10865, partial [Candidatus Limnocylindrales bacterium]
MDRQRARLALGTAVIVALIVACAPAAIGPGSNPPSGLSIAAGLAPGTYASSQPGGGPDPSPAELAQASSGTGATAPSRGPAKAPSTGGATPAPSQRPVPLASPKPTSLPTPKPTPKSTPKPVAAPPLSHCDIFPASNPWNQRITGLPVSADSATMIAAIGKTTGLHPDFGSFAGYGIPYNIVSSSTPRSSVTFQYSSES